MKRRRDGTHHHDEADRRELGVSITTVSKVLNNREDIGHATRARVLAKVAELGYQPNAVARSLTLAAPTPSVSSFPS